MPGRARDSAAEVEDYLRRHDAVAGAAVVGAPDEVRGQIVKAYVQLRPGAVASEEMRNGLRSFVRDRLAAYQYPRAITFVDALPMTPSGKIDRSSLRLQAEREAARGGQQRGS